ncbi:MAG: biotin--[acetyl-CoA-carboxylase] ligase [Jatrophihabitans sp.]|uniref:biotin--[acetyl-CoA-carboxylase] ligase n=1 Tax=Jatrophihabitans sp. TaxID=1932789 RepID=UPI003F7D120A
MASADPAAPSARTPLDAHRLAAAPWPVEVVAETASTNADLLARAAADGGADRLVLVAELQTAGRGRLDRGWESPAAAGLTFSALVRPPVPANQWGWLPLLTGVAVHDVLSGLTDHVTLKWPNDVLVGERKVAGLLAQSSGGAAVLGVGLNVSTTADELPVPTATSLRIEGVDADRTDVLVALVRALDARYRAWLDAHGDAEVCGLTRAYREACGTLGRHVAVTQLDGTTLRGRATDIDDAGRLLVDGDPVAAGDVEHLRPA